MRAMMLGWCMGLVVALGGLTNALAQSWAEFRPQGGRYFVLMPATAQTSTQAVPVPDGRSITTYMGTVETPTAVYISSFFDYPDDLLKRSAPDTHLDNGRNGVARGHTLRSEKRLTIASNPGREFVVARNDNIVMIARAFLVGPRFYQIMVVGRPGVEQAPDTVKFLESFRLLTGN